MKKGENTTEKLRENASWASIFDEFLNTPPTSSLFRLYFLCFIVWNKALILFIAFDPQPMGDKLSYLNWVKYTPLDFGCWLLTVVSTYGMPAFVASFIYSCSLVKFEKLDNQSLFFWLKTKHFDEVDSFNRRKEKILEIEEGLVDKEIDVLAKKNSLQKQKKEIQKNAPLPPDELSQGKYEFFKQTSFFKFFPEALKKFYYDERNVFIKPPDPKATYYIADRSRQHLYGVFNYLQSDGAISIISRTESYELNKRGLYFKEMYEFEKKNGIV